jgi:hypothetical protein
MKLIKFFLIAMAALSITACWEKKSEEPASTMEQMEGAADDMGQEMNEMSEEMEEEMPENN